MNAPSARLPAVLLLAAAAGCAALDVAGPDAGGPALRTDSLVHHAAVEAGEYRLTVGFTYRNDGRRPVYLPTCRGLHPPELERWVDGRWTVVHSPLILRCLEAPTALAAGASLRSEYQLPGGVRPADGAGPLAGTYRLTWRIYRSWHGSEPGELLPPEARASNEFRVVESDGDT